jgi:hypothetical protein
MTGQSFSLVPFPAPRIPEITITGKVSLDDHSLSLYYSLTGQIEQVLLPPTSASPTRRDELWKATCFEIFLAVKDQPAYWEFNMSPSGDWNIYRMDAYRRIGFRAETALSHLPFEMKKRAKEYSLDVSVDLASLFLLQQQLELGITAIVQTKDGAETYWALAHPAPQADFHLRAGFTLALAGQAHLTEQSALDGS